MPFYAILRCSTPYPYITDSIFFFTAKYENGVERRIFLRKTAYVLEHENIIKYDKINKINYIDSHETIIIIRFVVYDENLYNLIIEFIFLVSSSWAFFAFKTLL